jgi:hypothetical protein
VGRSPCRRGARGCCGLMSFDAGKGHGGGGSGAVSGGGSGVVCAGVATAGVVACRGAATLLLYACLIEGIVWIG